MIDPLVTSTRIASAGLGAQSTRMRILAENIANAHVAASEPGGRPYQRKVVSFEAAVDDRAGPISIVSEDVRPPRRVHEPGHPAADPSGFVAYPAIDLMMELADVKEANRSYLANLQMIRSTREAISATLDLLRSSS